MNPDPSIPEIDPTSQRRKSGCYQTDLNTYKDLISNLYIEQNTSTLDIARKLNLQYGLEVSDRTICHNLTLWNVKRRRGPASQELRARLQFHYNKNLNDEQIVEALTAEGFDINPKNFSRLRTRLGMRRRSRYPEYRESPQVEEGSTSTSQKRKAKMAHNAGLIVKVTSFVEKYMSTYDGSHDFNHIRRVVGLAHKIYKEAKEETNAPELDLQVLTLAALLHDVSDRKYLKPGQDENTLVLSTLLELGAEEATAIKVQRIVLGVDYFSEIKDPASVKAMIEIYPELALVQDADRLDAIGAVGIGRTFTYSGAKGAKNMGETLQHFEDKLEKLEGMMKTNPGKRMARERTERLKTFKQWWAEEETEAEVLIRPR